MVQRGCNGSALGARAVRDAFYVQRASWQRRVVRRGVALARQAVSALADAPDRTREYAAGMAFLAP